MRAQIAILLVLGLSQCLARPSLLKAEWPTLRLAATESSQVATQGLTRAPIELLGTPDEMLLYVLEEWRNQVLEEFAQIYKEDGYSLDATPMPGAWSAAQYLQLAARLRLLRRYLQDQIAAEEKAQQTTTLSSADYEHLI